MNTPRLTCRLCGRIQAIRGADRDAATLRLRGRCEVAGCVSDPVYRAAFRTNPTDGARTPLASDLPCDERDVR